MYLVLSAFTSKPISLLAITEASVYMYTNLILFNTVYIYIYISIFYKFHVGMVFVVC